LTVPNHFCISSSIRPSCSIGNRTPFTASQRTTEPFSETEGHACCFLQSGCDSGVFTETFLFFPRYSGTTFSYTKSASVSTLQKALIYFFAFFLTERATPSAEAEGSVPRQGTPASIAARLMANPSFTAPGEAEGIFTTRSQFPQRMRS